MRTAVMLEFLFSISCLLVACQQPQTQDTTQPHEQDDSAIKYQDHKLQLDINSTPVRYADNKVILSKIHLSSIKPARYQPSFTLQGIITPLKSSTLYSPTDATIKQWFIKIGDTVKKGSVLGVLTPTQNTTATPTDNLDNDELVEMPPNIPEISLIAPFDGVVASMTTNPLGIINPTTPLITINDVSEYKLVSRLPAHLKQHIAIGDTVELGIDGQGFSGQVKHLIKPSDLNAIDVHIKILPQDIIWSKLPSDQLAKAVIEYGQIEVGALLPDFAIVDEYAKPLDLDRLHQPPYKPQAPIIAHAWVIKQDATLHFAKIHVIEYQPNTRRFLVSGITEDSLVVLTHLPKQVAGKQVRVE
ncbi:efflux RND transporter periplasmic adaptor subunit [Moraxella sp. ZY200743]|uniref:efflux RND transporter periplasmic adaptor subunit n=1 Tax=Moraxella sp. ZY200743 TaxID=2911970 RepID=UPI003D7CCC87